MYKFLVCITPHFYRRPEYFQDRLKAIRASFGDEALQDMCLVVSYRFYKPKLTNKSFEHFAVSAAIFGKTVIECSDGVEFGEYREPLEALGIEIHPGYAPVSCWKNT